MSKVQTHPSYFLWLGFISGLPFAFIHTFLPAWFTASSRSLSEIGLLSLVGVPYLYKFLWAPVFDYLSLPNMGRRRGWMLLLFLLFTCGLLSMGCFASQLSVISIAMFALGLAFISASFDVVVDAYRTEALTEQTRALGTAWHVGGYRAALWAMAFVLIVADKIHFQAAFLMLGVVCVLLMIAILRAPEASLITKPASISAAFKEPLLDFFKRSHIGMILLIVLFYKFGEAFVTALSTPFLMRELGFSLSEVSLAMKMTSAFGLTVGAFLGGVLVPKWGMHRSLFWFAVVQVVSNAGYYLLAILPAQSLTMWLVLGIEHLTGGMGTAAFLTFIMAQCHPKYSATQFALLTAVSAVGRVVIGPFAGHFVEQYGFAHYYILGVMVSLIPLLLLGYSKVNEDATVFD